MSLKLNFPRNILWLMRPKSKCTETPATEKTLTTSYPEWKSKADPGPVALAEV